MIRRKGRTIRSWIAKSRATSGKITVRIAKSRTTGKKITGRITKNRTTGRKITSKIASNVTSYSALLELFLSRPIMQ